MACINMLNSEHHSPPPPPPMSPRISFSNDFIVGPPPPSAPRHASSDINFEFSASGNRGQMMAADELFFKGRMLPLRGPSSSRATTTTTLRDELRAQDGDAELFAPTKVSSIRWKELFGLKKPANCAAVTVNKSDGVVQELNSEGNGRGTKDVEMSF